MNTKKNTQKYIQYSRSTDKGASIAETQMRTVRDLIKKPVFEKGKADWLSELRSIIKKYNFTIHQSIKKKPIDASKKVNEKIVFSKFQDKRQKPKPKNNVGDLVRTADIKKVSKGDSINYSYKLYPIT